MTNISPKNRLDAIDVLRLSDDDAVQWLKEKLRFKVSIFSTSPERVLHRVASFAFSRRGSKRVRQAVARYGSHIRSLRNLLNIGSNSERLAVLSNPYIGPQNSERNFFSSDLVLPKSDAEAILKNYQSNVRELAALANNPHINRDWLSDRISSWMEIEGFDSNGLLLLVHYLVDNPIINSRRDETVMDGWADFSYYRLNFALADLLQTVPVTTDWADVLSRMLPNLYLSHVPDFEIDLIERWKDPELTEHVENFSFPYLREQITRYLIVRNHRSEVKEKYSLEHDDSAVRKGFYSSLQPYELFKDIARPLDFCYPSFRYLDDTELSESQQQLVDFCKRCFERDKNDFVESLIWNENFWKSKEDRGFLNDIAWSLADDPHSLMDVPNLKNARKQYHLEHNPSFFKDDEFVDAPYKDTVDGKLSKLQEELSKLQEHIKSQSLEALADEQRSHFESIIEDTQSQIREELSKLQEHIKSQSLEDLADKLRSHFESIIEDTQSQIRYLSDIVSEKTEELARIISQGSLAQQFQALESRLRYQGGLIWLLVVAVAVMAYLNMNGGLDSNGAM